MDVGKIDVVQVDLTRCGGFTEAMKIASLAADRGLPVVNHGFTTYLNVAAALHFLASIPNTLGLLEFVVEEGTTLRHHISEPIRAVDGRVAVPDAPGLGLAIARGGARPVPGGLSRVPASAGAIPPMRFSFLFYEPIEDLDELDRRMGLLAGLGYRRRRAVGLPPPALSRRGGRRARREAPAARWSRCSPGGPTPARGSASRAPTRRSGIGPWVGWSTTWARPPRWGR